jgi:hypothetical protein
VRLAWRAFVLAFFAVASWVSPAFAEDQLVLSAKPSTKVESGPDASQRSVMSVLQADQFAVAIVKRGDRYFWASRESRELFHTVSGAYHLFIDPKSGGYVKVEDQSALPAALRGGGPAIQYVEQLALGLVTVTYWGSADLFNP